MNTSKMRFSYDSLRYVYRGNQAWKFAKFLTAGVQYLKVIFIKLLLEYHTTYSIKHAISHFTPFRNTFHWYNKFWELK